MSDEWRKYVADPRIICKYGVKCYQKSSQHHTKYKHPPQSVKRKFTHRDQPGKRMKPDYSPKKLAYAIDKPNEDEDTSNSNSVTAGNTSKEYTVETVTDAAPISTLPENITYYSSNVDIETTIKELFLVVMPKDFYQFYECLKEEVDIEKTLSGVNLELIGPYELLMGRLPVVDNKELYLIHWRFFYDPPEFQAVLKSKGKSQYHIGYFRDSPDDMPVFLGSNDSTKDCHITPVADNIFAAVYLCLQNEKKRSPFTSMACQRLMEKVKKWAEKYNFSVEPYNIKKRLQNILTKSFHGAGIVVPYNKKTQLGYRNLAENDATLKKILLRIKEANSQTEKDAAFSELQHVITYASIAVDECDFGTGLELGIDLFASGLKDVEQSAISLLCSSYPLLKRDNFCKIIQAHLKYRSRGRNLSLLNFNIV